MDRSKWYILYLWKVGKLNISTTPFHFPDHLLTNIQNFQTACEFSCDLERHSRVVWPKKGVKENKISPLKL